MAQREEGLQTVGVTAARLGVQPPGALQDTKGPGLGSGAWFSLGCHSPARRAWVGH